MFFFRKSFDHMASPKFKPKHVYKAQYIDYSAYKLYYLTGAKFRNDKGIHYYILIGTDNQLIIRVLQPSRAAAQAKMLRYLL